MSEVAVGYVIWYGKSSGRYNQVVHAGNATSYAVAGLSTGTKYYLAVQAYSQDGTLSVLSAEVVGITGSPMPAAPPAPYSLALTVRDRVAELRWQTSGAGALAYHIELGTAPGRTDISRFTTGPTTTFAIGDLPARTYYYIRVRSANDVGVSAPSNEVRFERASGPDAPRQLTAAILPGTIARLRWAPPSDPTGVTGYLVEIGSAPGRKDLGSTALRALEISIPAIASRIYFVRVRSLKSSGLGSASNEVVVQFGITSTCTRPPGPPTLVARVANSMVQLTWSRGTGDAATGYLLDVVDLADPARGEVLTAQFGASTMSVWTPAPHGIYAYRLRAVNKCGASRFTPETTATVGATAALPSAPVGLQQGVSGRSMSLTWSPPFTGDEATRYVIEVTDSGRLPVLTADTGNSSTSFTYDGVPPGEYTVRVRAANTGGVGAPSNSVAVVIRP